jgi:Tol biopolymer transport system component
MTLDAGTRLGPYEIIDAIGAGGMGEVYRARDSRLGRDVAIKTLPPVFADDAERIARFEREARLLASLNHSSIAAIYGLEHAAGAQFIVLELVEGGSLRDRLRRGPLEVGDALRLARDVADAMQAAHDKGIIHRDLKPANIALTASGRPKILDFGLAKAFSNETTATTVDGGTQAGVMLGTLPYMSPEQARGLAVDRRSDIWSFGCVLYEALTGRPPFGSGSASETLVAILERDPDFDALPEKTPSRIRWLLRRCLEKDPNRRLHDIADARIEIEEALARPESASGVPPAAPGATKPIVTRERIAWLVAAAAVGLALIALASGRRPAETPGTAEVFRSDLVLPRDLRLTSTDPAARFALSPDGRRLAIVAAGPNGVTMLWIRSLDSPAAQPIVGTEGAQFPFWSRDSKSVGFLARSPTSSLGAGGPLRTIDLQGGQPVTIAENAFNGTAAWGPDDVILFTASGNSPLFRAAASSLEQPVAVTTLDEASGDVQHSFPSFLPDGRHFVFTVIGSRTGANEARAVYLGSLDGNTPPRLLIDAASRAQYANGHLLFLRDATLLAQRFNATTLAIEGDPVRVAEGVQITPRVSGGTGAFSASTNGVLIYQTGVGVLSQLAWIDRQGQEIRPLGAQADYADLALSPDASRVLVSMLDPQLGTRDLVLYEVARQVRERFTTEPSDDYAPVWSPDGARVAYTSAREGSIEIYERSFAGSPDRTIASGGSRLGKFAASWSRDGQLAYIAGGRALARSDIHVAPVAGGSAPRPLLESPAVETQARFSPDGRWLAYASNESGRLEVYVVPFPGPGMKQRVSIDGGGWPRWRSDGREIFFLQFGGENNEHQVFAADVTQDASSIRIGDPKALFRVRLRPLGRLDAYPYDVTPDGQRFLFNTFVEEATSTGLTLVVNWPSAIR